MFVKNIYQLYCFANIIINIYWIFDDYIIVMMVTDDDKMYQERLQNKR